MGNNLIYFDFFEKLTYFSYYMWNDEIGRYIKTEACIRDVDNLIWMV